jgi:hypothetical protein
MERTSINKICLFRIIGYDVYMGLSVSRLQTDSITQHISYFKVIWVTNQIWNKLIKNK